VYMLSCVGSRRARGSSSNGSARGHAFERQLQFEVRAAPPSAGRPTSLLQSLTLSRIFLSLGGGAMASDQVPHCGAGGTRRSERYSLLLLRMRRACACSLRAPWCGCGCAV
jgi:hypothetical protein